MNPPSKTKFSQGEAALAVGYVKSKISQDMKDGTLSFKRLEKNGRVEIDASDLIRVYGDRFRPERLTEGSKNTTENVQENNGEPVRTHNEHGVLAVEVKFLHEKIALLEKMTAAEREQVSLRIEEMRKSLEDARHQRDQALQLLKEQTSTVKLLTDQRSRDTAIPVPPTLMDAAPDGKRRGLFGWLGRRAG